jgi:putative Holliday junction resolvase
MASIIDGHRRGGVKPAFQDLKPGRGAAGMPGETEGKSGEETRSRWMGLDVGDSTIGVALSDEMGWTAQPHTVLRRKPLKRDLEELRRIAEEYRVREVVIGLPLPMSGIPGSRVRRVKIFAGELEATLRLPIVFWDERLTTVAAERMLIQADLSRAKRKKQVDKIAAAMILQGYLDSRRV